MGSLVQRLHIPQGKQGASESIVVTVVTLSTPGHVSCRRQPCLFKPSKVSINLAFPTGKLACLVLLPLDQLLTLHAEKSERRFKVLWRAESVREELIRQWLWGKSEEMRSAGRNEGVDSLSVERRRERRGGVYRSASSSSGRGAAAACSSSRLY